LAASIPAAVKALKMVDFPTFGKPTIPQRNPITTPAKTLKREMNTRPFNLESSTHPFQKIPPDERGT
jgi:hypothetical protein